MMARSFKKIVAFAFILTFTFGIAHTTRAQDADKDIIRPLTAKGSAAFVFTLGGLGNFKIGAPGLGSVTLQRAMVTAGEGGLTTTIVDSTVRLFGMGAKYFFSDDMALRISLAFNSMSSGADTLGGKLSSTIFGVGLGVEDHLRPLYSTSPYVGAQVSFLSGSSTNTVLVGKTDQDTKTSSSDFRIAAIAGFDWFFTRGMAIGAEGMLGFDSQSFSVTPASGTETSYPSTTTISLATEGNVHFVVYF